MRDRTRTGHQMGQRAAVVTSEDVAGSLSQQEAAAILHVSITSVKRYIRSGRLGAVMVGNRYRIPRRALEDFVQQSAHR